MLSGLTAKLFFKAKSWETKWDFPSWTYAFWKTHKSEHEFQPPQVVFFSKLLVKMWGVGWGESSFGPQNISPKVHGRVNIKMIIWLKNFSDYLLGFQIFLTCYSAQHFPQLFLGKPLGHLCQNWSQLWIQLSCISKPRSLSYPNQSSLCFWNYHLPV